LQQEEENSMTFEFNGKKYAQASDHQKEWGTKLIYELDLKGTESILDLGCGDGELTARLSQLVPNGSVLGIDSSQGMLDVAEQKKGKNLEFMLLDINKLSIKRKFNVIYSNACLQWVKNHEQLWNTILKHLKPSGAVRLSFAADGNCINFFEAIHSALACPEYKADFSNFKWPWYMPNKEEYEALIPKDEFSEIKVWIENADRYFPNEEKITNWIEQPCIVPFLNHISESKKKPFRDYVVQKTLKLTKQADGTFFEVFRRLNVFARKK
jgi:trans-aconitate methyltransferase